MSDGVKELVALKGGSEKAFESVYNRYSGKLYNFIMTISQGDSYLAEEMVQSAFIKLWEIRGQLDPEKSIPSCFPHRNTLKIFFNNFVQLRLLLIHFQQPCFGVP